MGRGKITMLPTIPSPVFQKSPTVKVSRIKTELTVTYHGNKWCQECKFQKTMAGHSNYYASQQPENISTKPINAKTTDG